MTDTNKATAARAWAVAIADLEHLAFEVGATFDDIMNNDPMIDPWEAASEALYEWDI